MSIKGYKKISAKKNFDINHLNMMNFDETLKKTWVITDFPRIIIFTVISLR